MIPESITNAIYVTLPTLQINEKEEEITIINEVFGTTFKGPRKKLLEILSFFRKPRTIKELFETTRIEFSDVGIFLEKAFIINVDLLLLPVTPEIGELCRLSRLIKKEITGDIAVLGSPFDSASAGEGGARLGPLEIRSAFDQYHWPGSPFDADNDPFKFVLPRQERKEQEGTETSINGSGHPGNSQMLIDLEMGRCYCSEIPKVIDLGNLRHIFGESVRTFGDRIRMMISILLDSEIFPILLGGDHSLTHFVLQELLERHQALGIIHVDAHTDLWPGYTDQLNHIYHGNAFLIAIKSKSMKYLFQLGLRSLFWTEPSDLVEDKRVQYLSARQLQHMSPEQIFEKLPRDIPYYLSFDIDSVLPSFAPETGTPLAGGLTYYQGLDIVDFVSRNFNLVGVDFMEVGGRVAGHMNQAAHITARYILQILLGKVEFKSIDTYIQKAPLGGRA